MIGSTLGARKLFHSQLPTPENKNQINYTPNRDL